MKEKQILIVDDEKNIRLTMSKSLDPLGIIVRTAVNGEEALKILHEAGPFGLVLLDLKMPGMDGMEVLRKIKVDWPELTVIIITAHGTIECAVEAMKLGAVDFIQKPFSPGEIRDLVTLVIERENLNEENAIDYHSLIELTKRNISGQDFSNAGKFAKKAIAADPGLPEAYNLLGVIYEMSDNQIEALKYYRAALDIDPTYKPANANLERGISFEQTGKIDLGSGDENSKPKGHRKE